MSYNYDTLNIFCENEKEKQRVKEYVDSVKDYYANGDLKATGDNGYVFPGATASNVVKVLINAHSTYDEKMAPYYEQAQKDLGIDLQKLVIETNRDGWINFNEAIKNESPIFERP